MRTIELANKRRGKKVTSKIGNGGVSYAVNSEAYVARIRVDGERVSLSFAIAKYGEQAEAYARAARYGMLAAVNAIEYQYVAEELDIEDGDVDCVYAS